MLDMAASTLIFVSYLVLFQMAENSTLISAGELPEWYLFDKNGLALAFFDRHEPDPSSFLIKIGCHGLLFDENELSRPLSNNNR